MICDGAIRAKRELSMSRLRVARYRSSSVEVGFNALAGYPLYRALCTQKKGIASVPLSRHTLGVLVKAKALWSIPASTSRSCSNHVNMHSHHPAAPGNQLRTRQIQIMSRGRGVRIVCNRSCERATFLKDENCGVGNRR